MSAMGLSDHEKAARVEMMKSRFAYIIRKSDNLLSDQRNAFEDELMSKRSAKDEYIDESKKGPTPRPKVMTFNDRTKVMELEIEAEARLRKRRRLEDIKRQRKAARNAINKVTKTVDFDNLSVINEFQKLVCSANSNSDYLPYGTFLVSHN